MPDEFGEPAGSTAPSRSNRGASPNRPRLLTIAGSDSGGGAGIQADLKTFSALGAYGMTAITAVTVQNTKGVAGHEELSPHIVGAQIRAVATDIGVDAAKTGMLASAKIVDAVVDALREIRLEHLVVDPIITSKHGDHLLAEDAVDALKETLLPLAGIVTPNLPEAGSMVGRRIDNRDDMRGAAEQILSLGPASVLVKGGHMQESSGTAADLFADATGRVEWIEAERIDTRHTHGTGCTLSAAIATYLARGEDVLQAVRLGKAFVTEAIRHALPIGQGIGPVDQLWSVRV